MVCREPILDGTRLMELRERVRARDVHTERRMPNNPRSHRSRSPHRAAASSGVTRGIRFAGPLEGPVIGELVRLYEPRRVRGVPRAAIVLPLLMYAHQYLEPSGHLFRHDDLQGPILQRLPVPIPDLIDRPQVRIDSPEPTERLERCVRVETIDVHPRVPVSDRSTDVRYVQRHLARELAAVTDDPLIDSRLTQVVSVLQGSQP